MKAEFVYNFIGKLSTALTTLAFMPFVGYVYGDFYLGLYGILATITIIILVLEGGLSSTLISELAKFRNLSYDSKLSMLLFEYFLFFCIVGLFSIIAVNFFGAISVQFIDDIEGFKEKKRLFFIFSLYSFFSLMLLYFQSVSYGLGFYKFYNITISLFSIARILIPFILLHAGFDVDFIKFLEIVLAINFLCLLLFLTYGFRSGVFLPFALSATRFKYLMLGLKYGYPIFLVSLSSIFYTQFDKIFGLRILSLEDFGVYATAASFASAPMILAGVIYSVMLPKFSFLVCQNDKSIVSVFKKYSKFCALFLFSFYLFSIVFICFCINLLSPSFLLVNNNYDFFIFVISILLLGSVLQAYSALPYALQVAQKNVKFTLKFNYFFMPFFYLIIFYLSEIFDGYGLPFFWLFYNVLFLISIYFIFLRKFISS